MGTDARLETLLLLAGRGDCLADIGADHGYLAAAALEKGAWQRCVVTDVSAPCVARARANLTERGLADRCRFACGDGFAPLEAGEAQAAVIAGMGADVIRGILSRGFPVKRAVIQCMSATERLRAFLAESGFAVIRERPVFASGRWYVVMAIEKGEDVPYTATELELGKHRLPEDEAAFGQWLDFRLAQARRFLAGAKGDTPEALAYRRAVRERLDRWEKVRRERSGKGC